MNVFCMKSYLDRNEWKSHFGSTQFVPAYITTFNAGRSFTVELIPDLHELGYLIEPFGKDAFIIQGTPADVEQGNEKASH